MNTNRCKNHSNLHNNTSAGTVLSTHYKGGMDGMPVVEQLVALRRRPLTSDDSRSAYENSSIDDTTPPAIAVVPDFTS